MERDWILVGMMGSGKSTVGKLLAERSGRLFQDTDQLVVHRLGRPVHQLFSIYGQDAFRDHETSVLKGLEPSGKILATGGGIVVRDANWLELRRLGLTAFLDLAVEVLIERLEKSAKRRPLLEFDDWQDRLRKLLDDRRSQYEKADIIVKLETEDLEGAADRLFQEFNSQT
jgi:shikimate kinase